MLSRSARESQDRALGDMEPIFSEQSNFWIGLAIAAVFIVMRSIERMLSRKRKGPGRNSQWHDRSLILKGMNIFIFDGIFALSYLVFGLQTALVYRLVIGLWDILKKLGTGYEKAPFLVLYMISANSVLAYILVEGSLVALHLYGLIVFTFWYTLVFRAKPSKLAPAEGEGALARIRISCSVGLTYIVFVGLGELLWAFGGVDCWIWFLVFVKVLATMGGLISTLFVLPFLKALMRSVRATSGPLG